MGWLEGRLIATLLSVLASMSLIHGVEEKGLGL